MVTEVRQSFSPSLSQWLFPGIFMVVGAVILLFGLRNLWWAHSSTTWPITAGVIKSAKIGQSKNRKGTTYRAEVAYDYAVSGVLYSGDQIVFGDYGLADPGHARSIVNRYPPGKNVTVYYSQADPKAAVLEPGLGFSSWLLPIGGAIFLGAGYFLGPSRRRDPALGRQV